MGGGGRGDEGGETVNKNDPSHVAVTPLRKWPLITDLPEREREPFTKWLTGQTCPMNEDGTVGYFPWDYSRWKDRKPIVD